MNVWTGILNSLPQSFAIAILTSVFTGFIIYYFQRRIEESFNKKMEQFKTDLQKELIDHQIKFSTTYQDAVEALDTGYHKLNDLSKVINDSLSNTSPNLTLDSKDFSETRSELFKASAEYTNYINDNRRYLPDEIIPELEILNKKAFLLVVASIVLLANKDESTDLNSNLELFSTILDKQIDNLKESLKVNDTEAKSKLFNKLAEMIDKESKLLKEDFNKLYKSVSGG